MVRCCGTETSAEAASTALTAKGYVRELGARKLPQLQPLWAPKANNKLLVLSPVPWAMLRLVHMLVHYTHTHCVDAPTHQKGKDINVDTCIYAQAFSRVEIYECTAYKQRQVEGRESLKAAPLWRPHYCVNSEMEPEWGTSRCSARSIILYLDWLRFVGKTKMINSQINPGVPSRILC